MHSAGLISIKTACPEGIIPERFNINHVNNNWNIAYRNNWLFPDIQNPSILGDGTEVGNTGICSLGKNEGENVNYLYCNKISYRNTPIISDGTIGKLVKLNIDLVLDPKDSIQKEQDLGNIGHSPYNISSLKVISYKCSN
jgi:hypothetical protein